MELLPYIVSNLHNCEMVPLPQRYSWDSGGSGRWSHLPKPPEWIAEVQFRARLCDVAHSASTALPPPVQSQQAFVTLNPQVARSPRKLMRQRDACVCLYSGQNGCDWYDLLSRILLQLDTRWTHTPGEPSRLSLESVCRVRASGLFGRCWKSMHMPQDLCCPHHPPELLAGLETVEGSVTFGIIWS